VKDLDQAKAYKERQLILHIKEKHECQTKLENLENAFKDIVE
jgi:hypothetical protein